MRAIVILLMVFFSLTSFVEARKPIALSKPPKDQKTQEQKFTKHIILEGHDIDYDQINGVLRASQNVSLRHRYYQIDTEALHFQSEEKLIEFPATFNIYGRGYDLSASQFRYDFESNFGSARSLSGQIGKLRIKGEKIKFHSHSVEMKNATFTTCSDPTHSHYKLDSKQLVIYPKFGFMVAFDNWMSMDVLPISLWIPSFVYGSDLALAASPLPEFGSNEREGFFIKQRFSYFMNQNANGTLMVGTTDRMGMTSAIHHNQIIDDQSILFAQLQYYGTEDFGGGLVYTRDIPKEMSRSDELNLDIFDHTRDRHGQVYIKWLSKQLINDSLVDFNPQVGALIDEFETGLWDWRFIGDISLGHIREDQLDRTIVVKNQGNLNATLKQSQNLTERLKLHKDVNFFGYWYSDDDRWLRLFSKLTLEYEWDVLHPKIFYRNVHTQTGRSPFEFQRTYATEENEYGFSIKTQIGNWETGLKAEYIARTGDRKRFEYVNAYHFHCWKIGFSFESVEERLSLGFSFF